MSHEDIRLGPLTIDPVTGAPNPSAAENPEPQKKFEKRINPEDERLPGGARWTGKVSDAVEKRWDRAKLWATTWHNRESSLGHEVSGSRARAHESIMNKRSNVFLERETKHTQALAELEARNGIWTMPLFRNIASAEAGYHKWRELVNRRKGASADARAERSAKKAESHEKLGRHHDGAVAERVARVTGKWEKKLELVRQPRERIDRRINELASVIRDHESLISKIEARTEELKNMRGGDRSERAESLRNLYKSLAAEKAHLNRHHDMYRRAHLHRVRLGSAHDSGEGAIQEFKTHYEDHEPWVVPTHENSGQPLVNETPQETGDNSASRDDILRTLQELAESKGTITNEQFGKLWDRAFPGAKLPNGYKTLTTMMRSTFQNRNISDGPADAGPVSEFLRGLQELFDHSTQFKELVEHATHRRGPKGINTLLSALENRIAFMDDFNSL